MAPPKLLNLWEIAGNNYHFVRLAGLSGATAVIMGAYGKHYLVKIIDAKEQMESKAVFETANRFHFLHSFALLAMPLARRPVLVSCMYVICINVTIDHLPCFKFTSAYFILVVKT